MGFHEDIVEKITSFRIYPFCGNKDKLYEFIDNCDRGIRRADEEIAPLLLDVIKFNVKDLENFDSIVPFLATWNEVRSFLINYYFGSRADYNNGSDNPTSIHRDSVEDGDEELKCNSVCLKDKFMVSLRRAGRIIKRRSRRMTWVQKSCLWNEWYSNGRFDLRQVVDEPIRDSKNNQIVANDEIAVEGTDVFPVHGLFIDNNNNLNSVTEDFPVLLRKDYIICNNNFGSNFCNSGEENNMSSRIFSKINCQINLRDSIQLNMCSIQTNNYDNNSKFKLENQFKMVHLNNRKLIIHDTFD